MDLAVMHTDGGEAISDLAVLRGQSELFGAVASDPTEIVYREIKRHYDDHLNTGEKKVLKPQ